MDSDVSVEGDGDCEQSPTRSSTSNQSGGSRSSSASPERNTDDEQSSTDEEDDEEEEEDERAGAKTPPARPPQKQHAPAAVAADDSSSDGESSPERHSEEASDGGGNSSPEVRQSRNGAADDRDPSPERRPEASGHSSGDTTPDMNDDAEDDDSSPESPDTRKQTPPIQRAESTADTEEDEEEDDEKRTKSPDSSPDAKLEDDNSDRETMSPAPRANAAIPASPAAPVSPENGDWDSFESEMEKTAPNSPETPASPKVDVAAAEAAPEEAVATDGYNEYDTNDENSRAPFDEEPQPKKKSATKHRVEVESDDGEQLGSSVNGDAYPPKSPARRSASVCSDRSNIESSLDSVSPTQFERMKSSKTDDDEFEEPKAAEDEAERGQPEEEVEESRKKMIDFADDLSDVSDIESNDSFGDAEPAKEEAKVEEPIEEPEPVPVKEVLEDKHEDAVSLHVEGEEQLDFEAEEGECSPKPDSRKIVIEEKEEDTKPQKEQSDLEEGELTDDNDTKAEETERPVCRFFSRGHCTWGTNCRFIHPGVMDKGNYSMFETVRPIVTPGGPPPPNASAPMVYPMFLPHMAHPHLAGERGIPPPGAIRKEDQPVAESAWERGLRQAKEMIRKSSKRKETEVDFEDKKMNLTLNQDEIDKENDYYSRHSGSPVKSPELGDKWKMDSEGKSHRGDHFGNDLPPSVPHSGPDVPPLGYYPPLHHGLSRPDYWPHRVGALPYDDYGLRAPLPPYGPDFYAAAPGRRYMHPNSYYPPRAGGVGGPPPHLPEFYDRKQKHKPYPASGREVIVQKNDKPYKDESPARYRNRREGSPLVERARDDEWADPWMRSRSPNSGRRRRRKNTYSSGSSYSSSSDSSRSSSRSSLSSRSHKSRSRSKARSSGSQSSSRSPTQAVNRRKPMQFKLSPSSRPPVGPLKKNPKPISPSLLMERRAATERAMHMNPPPPSPKVKPRPHSPANATTTSPTKPKSGLPDRLLAHSKAALTAAMRSARSSSQSSKSSSASSSSDSSSDSSDSSGSSSSSSKSSRTPPIRAPKRTVPDERVSVSQTVKAKGVDALKLSGQKQQIKLTLKGSAVSNKRIAENSDARKERQPLAAKKRVAESSDSGSDSDRASPAKKSAKMNPKKGPPSRRDELLKQLKAVEDAIARKRSKNL